MRNITYRNATMESVESVPTPHNISANDLQEIGLYLARLFTLILSGAGTAYQSVLSRRYRENITRSQYDCVT